MEILKKLATLANELDKMGLTAEATEIDLIIEKLGQNGIDNVFEQIKNEITPFIPAGTLKWNPKKPVLSLRPVLDEYYPGLFRKGMTADGLLEAIRNSNKTKTKPTTAPIGQTRDPGPIKVDFQMPSPGPQPKL